MRVVENVSCVGKFLDGGKLYENIRFNNCQFEKCNASKLTLINCEFEECVFTMCNMSKSCLALNNRYDSGKFIKCTFVCCDISESSFNFPIIDSCEFRNCKLRETNFDGSRLSNTQFIGELDSCFFRGHSIYSKTGSLLSFSKFDPRRFPNKMSNVDFSMSKLVGVSFSDGIRLSECIFPSGEKYLYIRDLKKTITKAVQFIKSEWSDTEKETAIKLIEFLYFSNNKKEQEDDFIDSFLPTEMTKEGEGVGIKLFSLFRTIVNSSN